jgi:hypothetical protein
MDSHEKRKRKRKEKEAQDIHTHRQLKFGEMMMMSEVSLLVQNNQSHCCVISWAIDRS